MVELGEIAGTIDRERPAVIHVSAHNGLGGVALALNHQPLRVDPHQLASAVERARHRARGIVLNFCSSQEVGVRLARSIPAVMAWPGPMPVAQGQDLGVLVPVTAGQQPQHREYVDHAEVRQPEEHEATPSRSPTGAGPCGPSRTARDQPSPSTRL